MSHSQSTRIGNFFVQAMATHDLCSPADLRQVVRHNCPVKRYEPRDTAKWDEAYAKYKSLLTPVK